MLCDVCLKKSETEQMNMVFKDGRACYMNVCSACKALSKDFFIVLCENCGAIELWSKRFFAPQLNVPCDAVIRIVVSHSCLNCSEETIYRG
jgi:hypothetical protein